MPVVGPHGPSRFPGGQTFVGQGRQPSRRQTRSPNAGSMITPDGSDLRPLLRPLLPVEEHLENGAAVDDDAGGGAAADGEGHGGLVNGNADEVGGAAVLGLA